MRRSRRALVPFLRESAAIPFHQNMIRRAAEEALKRLERKACGPGRRR